ncbi:VanZ family protein [Paenibacillus sp. IB182496]|uniref:VanZ family protein n=1 Tax=Paenibacillus sabuli TaxID=2772509 RepID=A0A927BVG3_9BACL|nr:VanZ family protein [Paenibacillus sabuli]MBD2846219.1 VanZ family protein [Paenibacillus sabuli]
MNQTRHPAGRLPRWLPALLVMTVIFWLSSRTGDELDGVLPWMQRLLPWMQSFDWGHFVAYFALALAFDYALGARADAPRWKALIVLLCLLYGITDEYHQSFVAGRMPDPADLRNDTIGALAAVLLLAIAPIRRRWRKFAA